MAKNEMKPLKKGKVRDIYEVGEDKLLLVASDRVSAFDFVLPTEIPGKGETLTKMSEYWFRETGNIAPNHLITAENAEIRRELGGGWNEYFSGRSMLVKRAERIDFECVVRGYLAGSGWKEYLEKGSVCGVKLPPGLKQSEKLPRPVFTPASKSDKGCDMNLSFDEMAGSTGEETAEKLRRKSLELYSFAAERLERKGLILADTKLEFGTINGEMTLIDEIFTPDSSRFWDKNEYAPGTNPRSYDKQFVRDWLEKSGWDKKSPPPALPAEIVTETRKLYAAALKLVTKE